MKITDKCSMRDKKIETKLRTLESLIDTMNADNTANKDTFINIFVLVLELLIDAYKTLEDNTAPGKTVLDFTGVEVKSAVFRVGAAKNFDNDADFVIAVMQELR